MGTLENPSLLLELTGRPSNLRYVSLTFSPQTSPAANVQPLAAIIILFQATVPEWNGAMEWFTSVVSQR